MRIPSLASVALSLFVALLAANGFAADTTVPTEERVFSDWIKVLEPHLHAVWPDSDDPHPDGPQPFDWRHHAQFTIELDQDGPLANPYFIPGGAALKYAAELYAVQTGDFAVSLGDLERSGWWPYDTIPRDMDRSLLVADGQGSRVYNKNQMLKHIGSPGWLNSGKWGVELEFYPDFFYRIPAKEQTQRTPVEWHSTDPSATPPEMPKWTEDWEARKAKTVADLPERLPQFWINPFTSVPMRVSDDPGDIKMDDISFMSQNATFVDPDGHQNVGGMHFYDGREKAPPLIVARSNWKAEPLLPWARRAGQTLPMVPGWLLHGEDSDALKLHEQQLLTKFEPLDKYGNTRRMPLDTSGERAQLERLACPIALSLAANYYAIATGDTQVSLRDIVDGGFWPYDTFPPETDLEETLYDFPLSESIQLGYNSGGYTNGVKDPPGWDGVLASEMGTPQWLLWRKAEILNQVHSELYFNTQPGQAPAVGFDPKASDALPRFAAFWVNPIASAAAGKPVPMEFGVVQGQLSTVDVNLLRPLYYGAQMRYDQQVPIINLADKSQYAAGAEPQYIYRQRNVDGFHELSRTWPMPSPVDVPYGEVRWTYAKPVNLGEEVLADVGWDPAPPPSRPQTWQETMKHWHNTRTYKRGDWLGWATAGSMLAGNSDAQIVHDSMAMLEKRYGSGIIERQWDYNNLVNMLRLPGFGQLPVGKAGVDELAPPEVKEVAAK